MIEPRTPTIPRRLVNLSISNVRRLFTLGSATCTRRSSPPAVRLGYLDDPAAERPDLHMQQRLYASVQQRSRWEIRHTVAPDIVMGAGGVIHATAVEPHRESAAHVTARIQATAGTLTEIPQTASISGVTPAEAARTEAHQRIEAGTALTPTG